MTVLLLGAGLMASCSQQQGGGTAGNLELQAARQSVQQLQEQMRQVNAEMSDRIQKEGERVRAEMKPQMDRALADLDKAQKQAAGLEKRAADLEELAKEAARRQEEVRVAPEAIPSDLFLTDAGSQLPGIAVRYENGLIVTRTAEGTLSTNNIATLREIAFRSGPVLAGVAATNETVKLTAAVKPAVKAYRPPGTGVKLSPYWKAPVPGGDIMIKDLRILLAERAQPKAEPEVVENREILPGIYYQMPAQEVFKALGKRPAAQRKAIEAPGFPKQSFFYYEIAGSFNGYPGLLLITDTADQTMAVQLSNESMSERPAHSSIPKDEGYMIHNLVKGRKKPNINCFVNYRGSVTNDLVILESRLYDPLAGAPRNAQAWEKNNVENMRMKERHVLYLPQPVANLLSLCISFY